MKINLSAQNNKLKIEIGDRAVLEMPFDEAKRFHRMLAAFLATAPPPMTPSNPPDKTCFVCHARLDVPYAHRTETAGVYRLAWNCPSRCQAHALTIPWRYPPNFYLIADDLRRAGFTVID